MVHTDPALRCHAGEVIIGDVGFRGNTAFTALGDPVNVTARLQELSKTLSCRVIVSDEVCKLAGLPDNALTCTQVEIRGQRQPLIVRTEKDPTVLASLLAPISDHIVDKSVVDAQEAQEAQPRRRHLAHSGLCSCAG